MSREEQKQMLQLPSIEEQASNEKRPLMVDTWGYRNKNYIMYVPDGKDECNLQILMLFMSMH